MRLAIKLNVRAGYFNLVNLVQSTFQALEISINNLQSADTPIPYQRIRWYKPAEPEIYLDQVRR